jgi:hypothetical protein
MSAPSPTFYRRRVALFESSTFPGVAIVFSQTHGDDDNAKPLSGYMRISEWVDVDFNPSSEADRSQLRVNALMDEKRRIQADAAKKMEDIDTRIVKAMAGVAS